MTAEAHFPTDDDGACAKEVVVVHSHQSSPVKFPSPDCNSNGILPIPIPPTVVSDDVDIPTHDDHKDNNSYVVVSPPPPLDDNLDANGATEDPIPQDSTLDLLNGKEDHSLDDTADAIPQNGTIEVSTAPQSDNDSPCAASGLDQQESQARASILMSNVFGLVDCPTPEIASLAATNSTEVLHQPQQDTLAPIALADPSSLSSQYNDSQTDCASQQKFESFDELVAPHESKNSSSDPGSTGQESENAHSDATLLDSRQSKLQLEIEPSSLVEESPTSGVLHTVTEELESSQFDKSEQRVEEDTNTKLLLEAKENELAIPVPGRNSLSNLDQGNEAEISVNNGNFFPATGDAADPDINHNKDHSSVPSSSGFVQDTKDMNQYPDGSEISVEPDRSSSHSYCLLPTENCLERETVAPGELVESVQNTPEPTREHESQLVASPPTENSDSNADDACDPEIKDSSDLAVQSMDKISDVPKEHGIELEASPPTKSFVVNTAEVIKPETEKSLELDQSCTLTDSLLPTVNCLERETDAAGKVVESVQNVQESTTKDEVQLGASPTTENFNSPADEVYSAEIEDSSNVAVRSMDKISYIGVELVGSPPTGCLVVNADEVIKLETEKSLELDQPCTLTDTLLPAVNCLERETDAVGQLIEGVQNVQESITEDEVQLGASPASENSYSNTDEVCRAEIEDSSNFSFQSMGKISDIPGDNETEHEASPPEGSLVDNPDEVIEPETDPVSAVSGKLEGPISSPLSSERSEIMLVKDVRGGVLGESIHRCSGNSTASETELELEIADSREKILSFTVDNDRDKTEVEVKEINSSGGDCQVTACNCNLLSQTEVPDSSIDTGDNMPNSVPSVKDVEDDGDQFPVSDVEGNDKLLGKGCEDMEKSHGNEDLKTSLENSAADAVAGHNVSVGPLTRPFQFLIRMPRFDDVKVREQIRNAQVEVDEKTKQRDAFRLAIQKLRASCHGHAAECEAALSNARSSKRSVKSKRAEIDSLQGVINKVKNAMSIDDIDARIYSMEHMIQHETLPLKEEKQFIREIKQLKQLREQLSSNIGSQVEVQQAFNKREETEERLKILKKELDNLKDGVLKAEALARAAQKKYEDENENLKEIISQFEDANDVRQSAYHHLQTLKKEFFEKNKYFRMYKDNAAAATDYAASKDREALHHLCSNQVETIMDLWNKDDDFRKEYVRCNVRSTVRRLGTLDGRSLGPDEKPPVLTNHMVERVDWLVSDNTSSVVQAPILKQENQAKPVKDVFFKDDAAVLNEGDAKSRTAKDGDSVKPTPGNVPATISARGLNDEIIEWDHNPTKAELELVRKAEELRKEESAAQMREQRRLEEKSKALEALERKKRVAEKAQIRAELRAQKEAEQKGKEREKRLRKKERKKGAGADTPEGNGAVDSDPGVEISTETMCEEEIKDTYASVPKKPQKPSLVTKQSKTKSIPPPLRNRSKRKMQQWMWVILTCMLVIFLFILGNVGFFSNLSNLRQRNYSI